MWKILPAYIRTYGNGNSDFSRRRPGSARQGTTARRSKGLVGVRQARDAQKGWAFACLESPAQGGGGCAWASCKPFPEAQSRAGTNTRIRSIMRLPPPPPPHAATLPPSRGSRGRALGENCKIAYQTRIFPSEKGSSGGLGKYVCGKGATLVRGLEVNLGATKRTCAQPARSLSFVSSFCLSSPCRHALFVLLSFPTLFLFSLLKRNHDLSYNSLFQSQLSRYDPPKERPRPLQLFRPRLLGRMHFLQRVNNSSKRVGERVVAWLAGGRGGGGEGAAGGAASSAWWWRTTLLTLPTLPA